MLFYTFVDTYKYQAEHPSHFLTPILFAPHKYLRYTIFDLEPPANSSEDKQIGRRAVRNFQSSSLRSPYFLSNTGCVRFRKLIIENAAIFVSDAFVHMVEGQSTCAYYPRNAT